MMSRTEQAVSFFNEGYNCAQALLATFASELGIDRDMALRVSGGFGGGVAGMADTCGAVTGALMVIGLKYGMTVPGDWEATAETYYHVREFVSRFKSLHRSVSCRDLLGFDISGVAGLQHAKARKLFEGVCPRFIEDAARIVEELLEE